MVFLSLASHGTASCLPSPSGKEAVLSGGLGPCCAASEDVFGVGSLCTYPMVCGPPHSNYVFPSTSIRIFQVPVASPSKSAHL